MSLHRAAADMVIVTVGILAAFSAIGLIAVVWSLVQWIWESFRRGDTEDRVNAVVVCLIFLMVLAAVVWALTLP